MRVRNGSAIVVLIVSVFILIGSASHAAAQAVGALASAPDLALPALQRAQTDPRPFVRAAAAKSLGAFGDMAAPQIPGLIKLLSDAYLEVRLAAISTLGELGPVAISAELKIKALLVDPDILVRDASKAALLAIRRKKIAHEN